MPRQKSMPNIQQLNSLSARVVVKVVHPDEVLQRLVHLVPRLRVQPVRLGGHGLDRAHGEGGRHVEVSAGVTTTGEEELILFGTSIRM